MSAPGGRPRRTAFVIASIMVEKEDAVDTKQNLLTPQKVNKSTTII